MTQTARPASMRARSDVGAAPAVKRIKATCFDCQQTVTADAATVQCPSCRAIFHTHCQPQLEQQPNYKRSDPTWNPMRICTLGCQISKDMDKLSAWRRSPAQTRSASARSLVRAITLGRTPQRVAGQVDAEPLRVLNPYGCKGFELRRKLVNPQDQERLLHIINQRRIEWEKKVSMLTPSIRSNSRKVFCCTDAQRQLRGGRYAATLRASGTVDKLELRLKSGQDISDYIGRAFLTQDPFVIHTELLCQQVSWHFEDLELHCDRDRRDKTHDRQNVELDGVGDRITSLTLRSPCWLLMRQRSDNTNCFAVWLNPGDVYSLSGEARWDWQHAILLPNPVPTRDEKQKTDECRVSIVFRFIEEYPE